MTNPWMLLAAAIFFEVLATSLLKASDGFTRVGLGAASIASYIACFGFLVIVIQQIPVGVAYAIWSGAGIVGISVIGWLVFKQALTPMQLMFVGMILVGAVGLNLTTTVEAGDDDGASQSAQAPNDSRA